MSDQARTLPPALAEGRAGIDSVSGYDVAREFHWDSHAGAWVLELRLTSDHCDSDVIPRHTGWHILVSEDYPRGEVGVYPSKHAGIDQTFWHQSQNLPGDQGVPWRTGKVCLDAAVGALGREEEDEPYSATDRLPWRLVRLKAWVRAAATGELAAPGEPFELPDFSAVPDFTVAFHEDGRTLEVWNQSELRSGLMTLVRLRKEPDVYVVEAFSSGQNEPLLCCGWGEYIGNPQLVREHGAWLRLERVPHLRPWRAPRTWGELGEAIGNDQLDLLRTLHDRLDALRDGQPHILGIGFPIPARIGGPSAQMYWQFARLPAVSQPKRRGFRPGSSEAGWITDRVRLFNSSQPVPWVTSESWSVDDLVGRGALDRQLREQHVAVIGCGALGSAVSELLVREGVRNLVLADSAKLAAGNLVRHVLTLDNLGTDKAIALAVRLRAISPHATITVVGRFPPSDREKADALRLCRVLIDTTGDNAVVQAMEDFPWGGPKLFVSLSLGLFARVAYCFAAFGHCFPSATFFESVDPWLHDYRERLGDRELPRDGLGCWNPLFPARLDALWTLAGAAIPWIEKHALSPPEQPDLVLLEAQDADGPRTVTIRRGSPGD